MIDKSLATQVAVNCQMKPDGVQMLMGSLLIPLSSGRREFTRDSSVGKIGDSTGTGGIDIGLRLDGKDIPRKKLIRVGTKFLADIMFEYKKSCPVITMKVLAGGFSPTRLASDCSLATLRHANRTAGRLRAEIFRKMNS